MSAIEQRMNEAVGKRRQIELSLKQARFETSHARRQYDAVDPDNRLVVSELERRWNDQLVKMGSLEEELQAFDKQVPESLSEPERLELMRLGGDLQAAWMHANASVATRKRIVRAVLHEIVVRVEDNRIDTVLHWHGGDHTSLGVKKNKSGKHRWSVDEEVEVLVGELARLMPDRSIAAILNRSGMKTGRQNGWKQNSVCGLRNRLGIPVYRGGERTERGEHTLDEAASILDISPMTTLRMIRSGVLPARQLCKGAPGS
ncbi:MAG: helix-turn-helix domain-containing protein [Rhizobium sp.]|nr:helix-turn-helix domain-containing protein [Rhizobium sp.]